MKPGFINEPQSKRSSMEWRLPKSQEIQKSSKNYGDCVLGIEGVILVDFMPKGTTSTFTLTLYAN